MATVLLLVCFERGRRRNDLQQSLVQAQGEGEAEPVAAVRGLGECPLTSRLLPLALSPAQDISEAALDVLSSSLRASTMPGALRECTYVSAGGTEKFQGRNS